MELRLEVLHATGLVGAEYRLGDLSCSLLGSSDLRPYVEVTFQSQVQCSCPVQSRDGAVVFGWSSRFDFNEQQSDRLCTFRVYDKRGAQSALRGDPLIGEAELPLLSQANRNGLVVTFKLRRQRATTGELAVHYEFSRRPEPGTALCPGSALLGTAFGDNMVCAGQVLEQKMMPCAIAEAPAGQKSRRLSAELLEQSGHLTPESTGTSSTSLDQGLARSESSGSFHSIEEEERGVPGNEDARENLPKAEDLPAHVPSACSPLKSTTSSAPSTPLRVKCEGVAETYINARLDNNLDLIRGLFARDAVVAVPTALGSAAEHRGWRGIEAYLLNNPAKPGCHSDWAYHSTQDTGHSKRGGPDVTVVRWTGKVYRVGFWHQVTAAIAVDPRQLLIRRVDLARA